MRNGPCQLSDGRSLKKAVQRHLYMQERLEACCHLHRQQRMTTQSEKVVVDTDLLHPQHSRPRVGHHLFQFGARCHKVLRTLAHRIVGYWQGTTINLPASIEGK